MTESKALSPVAQVQQQFAQREHEFAKALPSHIPPHRFTRTVMTAIQNDLANPYSKGELLRADRGSLFRAAMQCAQDGLLPDGREAVLVAYGGSAQYQPMVAGIRKKVRQSGEIASWEARLVYASDIFKIIGGDEEKIVHEIDFEGSREDNDIRAVYSIAHFKDGMISRDWMTIAEVHRIRVRAKTQKVWNSDFGEMVKKTMLKRHSKALPLSAELDSLMQREDDAYDLAAPPSVTLAPSSLNGEDAWPPEIVAPKPRRGRPKLSDLGKEQPAIEHQASAPSGRTLTQQVSTPQEEAGEAPAETGNSVPAGVPQNPSIYWQQGYDAYENGAPLRPLPPGYRGHEKADIAKEWMAGWQRAHSDNQMTDDDALTQGAE